MEEKKKCISFGKFNKKYCMLISAYILAYFCNAGLLKFLSIYEKKKDDSFIYLELNPVSFAFFFYLCKCLMIIPELILNINSPKNKSNSNFKLPKIITVKSLFNTSNQFTLKDYLYLFCVSILMFISDFSYFLILYLRLDRIPNVMINTIGVYIVEPFFLFLFSKMFSKITYFKHQYYSIAILTIIGLTRFIMRCRFLFVTKLFVSFFLSLTIQVIYSTIDSFILIYIKGLMEIKFFSPFKVSYVFGAINLFFVIIIFICTTFYPCSIDLCQFEYNSKRYFAHIMQLFDFFSLYMFLENIFYSVIKIIIYITIHNFTVCHSFMILIFSEIFNGLLTPLLLYIIIFIIFGLIQIFVVLIFLEIIEINICKISENTKKNIDDRAKLEEYNIFESEKENNSNLIDSDASSLELESNSDNFSLN